MKNGEEVVSVGGAVDPSNKNVGTSASTSVILDLVKVRFRKLSSKLQIDLVLSCILCIMQPWIIFRKIGFGFSF